MLGNGGNIIINAPDAITIKGQGTLNAETSGTGSAGNIEVTTNRLTVDQGTRLSTTATDTARPPANTLIPSANINLNANEMNLFGTVEVLSETQGTAQAGTLTLKPNHSDDLTINLKEKSRISASTSGSGPGGSLILTAPQSITVSGDGILSAETNNSGSAGEVHVQAPRVTIQDGAQLSTSTSGSGPGGTLNIEAEDRLTLRNQANLIAQSTQIASGKAGELNLRTGQLKLDNATITVRSEGTGDAGDITLQANQATVMQNQSIIETDAGGNGNGGNISLETPFLISQPGENNDIIANAVGGDGGRIEITTQRAFNFEQKDGQNRSQLRSNRSNDLSASSETGTSGTIALNTLNVDPSRGLTELPTDLVDSSNQIRQGCNPSSSNKGSFINVGRGGIPPQPSGPLSSHSLWEDVKLPKTWTNASSTQNSSASANVLTPAVIEAQDWNINTQGKIQLLSQKPQHTQLACQISTQTPDT